ncbi:adhesive plaque matrix protein-like [Macrosteles quadrilineatus]|uniref:adhesive plaque matrix protein-like n=1 Tax=Macrosteles quadrilineatus TaxID=74068 RepID=UPI0023E17287|nr:adhesive plaque matrix protein-like [Macrosteles quadrilineatus]
MTYSALVYLSVCVAVATAVTPFFESPHNEKAAPFYKVPVQRDFSSPFPVYTGKSQSYKQSSYKSEPSFYSSEPSYKPEPTFYKPQPSFYKPEQSYYKSEPSYYKPEPSYYKPESYKSGYAQGATSYQTVRLGGGDYKPQYKPYY